MVAMGAIQTAKCPEASPRLAKGARSHGSRPGATQTVFGVDLKGSSSRGGLPPPPRDQIKGSTHQENQRAAERAAAIAANCCC